MHELTKKGSKRGGKDRMTKHWVSDGRIRPRIDTTTSIASKRNPTMGCAQSLDASALVPFTVAEWQAAFSGNWRLTHPEEVRLPTSVVHRPPQLKPPSPCRDNCVHSTCVSMLSSFERAYGATDSHRTFEPLPMPRCSLKPMSLSCLPLPRPLQSTRIKQY
jgi:hypothetical protein